MLWGSTMFYAVLEISLSEEERAVAGPETSVAVSREAVAESIAEPEGAVSISTKGIPEAKSNTVRDTRWSYSGQEVQHRQDQLENTLKKKEQSWHV